MKTIIEDTRQKATKHENKHRSFAADNVTVIRCALPYGDYAPPPKVAVDTKQDVSEIAYNMCGPTKEKIRFRKECTTAQDANCKLFFLIEDNHYSLIDDLYGQTIYLHNKQFISGDQLATAMHIMSDRYGCEFLFCKPDEAGRKIIELLEKYDGE